MKYILSLFALFLSQYAIADVVRLICVDKDHEKYQKVVIFDNGKNLLIEPRDARDVLIDKDKIFYTTVSETYTYRTQIYRATGNYVVYTTKDSKSSGSFSGQCQIAKNKF